MKNLKRNIRMFLAAVLFRAGVLNLLLRLKFKNQALVLMYHRVSDNEESQKDYQNGMTVKKKTFHCQMDFLRKHFHILSLSEFSSIVLNGDPFAKRSVLITFDDGWKDNYTHAFPVVKQFNIPMVLFLTAGFIDQKREFWQTRLIKVVHELCNEAAHDEIDEVLLRDVPHKDDLLSILKSVDEEKREERLSDLLSKLKEHTSDEIEGFIAQLSSVLGIPLDDRNEESDFLSWREVLEMQQQGVELGSHTVNHEILTRNKPIAQDEIQSSKSIIEKNIGRQVRSFSYPNGDYDQAIMEMVKDAGYETAFTTRNGSVTAARDRFAVPRINIHDDMTSTTPMFLGRILGFW